MLRSGFSFVSWLCGSAIARDSIQPVARKNPEEAWEVKPIRRKDMSILNWVLTTPRWAQEVCGIVSISQIVYWDSLRYFMEDTQTSSSCRALNQ